MVTLTVPYDFFSLVLASIVLVCAFSAAGYVCRRRSQAADGPRSASVRPIIGLVLAGCAATFAGVLITAAGTLDISVLQFAYISDVCELSESPHGVIQGSLGSADPGPYDFRIDREEIFMVGLGKFAEYHDYLEGLTNLAAIVVGVLVVTTARFFFGTEGGAIYAVLPRAATTLALASCSLVSLVASHHVLFITINGQLSLLGSGYAYCYANFAPVYTDLFWMIVFTGTSAVTGLLLLPESLRLRYQEQKGERQ